MAYTAPNDLFTSEEAILSLASSIADEDRTNLGNGTINGALDVLADALAERNVEVPPMNAGAILALADYVSGGGGGGTAHSITCKIINNMDTGELIDMPNFVGVASIQDDGRWGSDNPYVPPENPVEEAVGGTILYAHPYIVDKSTTYSAIGLGTPYADAFRGVALIGNGPVTSFAMPDDDVIVLYVSVPGGGGN